MVDGKPRVYKDKWLTEGYDIKVRADNGKLIRIPKYREFEEVTMTQLKENLPDDFRKKSPLKPNNFRKKKAQKNLFGKTRRRNRSKNTYSRKGNLITDNLQDKLIVMKDVNDGEYMCYFSKKPLVGKVFHGYLLVDTIKPADLDRKENLGALMQLTLQNITNAKTDEEKEAYLTKYEEILKEYRTIPNVTPKYVLSNKQFKVTEVESDRGRYLCNLKLF